jgi:hypothetical protein
LRKRSLYPFGKTHDFRKINGGVVSIRYADPG